LRSDLVICRNVMIYLKPEVQRRLILLFHFALAEGGALFLGSAERAGDTSSLFQVVDREARIWRQIGPTRHDGCARGPVPQGLWEPGTEDGPEGRAFKPHEQYLRLF
jgi:hypothetical protein